MPGEPSLSWLRRIFGHDPLEQKLAQEWPQLEQAWRGREIEMPSEAAKVNAIKPMSWLTKLTSPDAYASTNPFGVIEVNRDLIEREKQDLGDVLVHELAHVGQGGGGFLRKYYEPSAVENEAVDREALRKVRKKDIRLWPERK